MRNSGGTMVRLAAAAALALGAHAAHAQMYWRVDVGYSMAQDAGIKDKDFAGSGLICGNAACTTAGELNDVGQSVVLQGGLGWRLNPNWRAEVTLAYRPGFGIDDNDKFPSHFAGDITSTALMLNGYYDFSTSGVRPYLGAGVGYASNKVDNVVNTFGWNNITVPGGTSSGLAWSLMGGVGIPMGGGSMVLDIGGRYIDLGKIETDSGTATGNGVPIGTYGGMSGNLRAFELMIGLRF